MFEKMPGSEFRRKFKSEESCHMYLHQAKWREGFKCRRCGHTRSWKGRTRYHTRCTSCGYDESVTAFTIFHKCKTKLVTAFKITYHLTQVEDISALQVANLFDLNPKSAILLKKKIMFAYPLAATRKRYSGPKLQPLKINGNNVAIPLNIPIFAAQKLN